MLRLLCLHALQRWLIFDFEHQDAADHLIIPIQYEEDLRNADDTQGLHQQAQARAIVLYYSSRMEAVRISILLSLPTKISPDVIQAWREGNDGMADFMLQKIVGLFLFWPQRIRGSYIMVLQKMTNILPFCPHEM